MVDYYLEIIRKLDKLPQETPKVNGNISPTFLEYIKLWINPEEAEFLSHLGVFPSTMNAKKISKITNKPLEEVEDILSKLLKKGAVMKHGKKYSIHFPIVFFEAPMIDDVPGELGKKFAELSKKFYWDENWAQKFVGTKNAPLNRVIPITQSIESTQQILASEEIYKIIDEVDYIALLPCACRTRAEKLGNRQCDHPIDSCLIIGFIGKYFVERGKGREISKDEAKKIIDNTTKRGLIHITENFEDPSQHFLICSCCTCCCCIYAGLTTLNNPHAMAKANFIARVNENECQECHVCIDQCKFQAIEAIENGIKINESKCFGCGLCAVSCSAEKIKLYRKDRSKIYSDLGSLMMQMMNDTGKDIKNLI